MTTNISTTEVITWNELKHLVENNKILDLRREPSVLARYRAYKQKLIETNQSLFSHLVIDELKWASPEILKGVSDINELPVILKLKPRDPRLLGNSEDIKILLNDFPYYFEPNVTHLVVWTKVEIKSDPASELGDITKETRAIINRYVEKTFIKDLQIPREKVLWFRNWSALQSVRSLSHVHVIVQDLSKEQFDKLYKKSGNPVSFDGEDKDLSAEEYLKL